MADRPQRLKMFVWLGFRPEEVSHGLVGDYSRNGQRRFLAMCRK
jgi:hypothetical protein